MLLKSCSNICELDVAFILYIPLKYPLITDAIDTNSIAGESAIRTPWTSGFPIKLAIVPENVKSKTLSNKPIPENKSIAVLNIS